MHCTRYLLLVLAGLTLASCDSSEDEPGLSYFPHEVGQMWSYDYNSSSRSGGPGGGPSFSTRGVLTWTIDSLRTEGTVTHLNVTQSFSGTSEISGGVWDDGTTVREVSSATSSEIILRGDVLEIPGYTDAPDAPAVLWKHPPSAPDTVRVAWGECPAPVGCGCRGAIYLGRELGVLAWSRDCGDHRSGSSSRRITLRNE